MFNFKKNKFIVTAKIRMLFIKSEALIKLGNKYIQEDNDNRAREAYIDAEKYRTDAWEAVFFIYPKLNGKTLSYDYQIKAVKILEI